MTVCSGGRTYVLRGGPTNAVTGLECIAGPAAGKRLLLELKEGGGIGADDRRLADIEWYLGVSCLQLGRAEDALAHYRQAAASLRLRRANLQRAALDEEIAHLAQEADAPHDAPRAAANAGAGGEEVGAISELLDEIEARVAEVRQAMGAPNQ